MTFSLYLQGHAKGKVTFSLYLQERLPPIVQLTVQFIQTLRNGILGKMRWLAAVARLRRSMESYR